MNEIRIAHTINDCRKHYSTLKQLVLYDKGWATAQDDDGKMLISFFPKKEFAENCAVYEWSNFKAERIELDELLMNLIC